MSAMASQITGVSFIGATVCSGADQRNIKAPRNWPLWGEPETGGFPSQRTSTAENVSIWWHHHACKENTRNAPFLDKYWLIIANFVRLTLCLQTISPTPSQVFHSWSLLSINLYHCRWPSFHCTLHLPFTSHWDYLLRRNKTRGFCV